MLCVGYLFLCVTYLNAFHKEMSLFDPFLIHNLSSFCVTWRLCK